MKKTHTEHNTQVLIKVLSLIIASNRYVNEKKLIGVFQHCFGPLYLALLAAWLYLSHISMH